MRGFLFVSAAVFCCICNEHRARQERGEFFIIEPKFSRLLTISTIKNHSVNTALNYGCFVRVNYYNGEELESFLLFG